MHTYLRAVGFSKVDNRIELDKILGIVMSSPLVRKETTLDSDIRFSEMRYDFSERLGITIRGEYDELGFFHLDNYFPHAIGKSETLREELFVNRRVDTDAYTGMCEDFRVGVSLIFYLQNSIDYICSKKELNQVSTFLPISLSALSLSGTILLPIHKDEQIDKRQREDYRRRHELLNEASKGSQDAIEHLALEDIDTYSMINRRLKTEDIYSIVDTTFIPYGSESDNYTVIGTILEVSLHTNKLSGEKIYELVLNCNDLVFSVFINTKDLEGNPLPGRRFKGNVWMQGCVDFSI